MKVFSAISSRKMFKFYNLKRVFAFLLCLSMCHCSSSGDAPKKENKGGNTPIIPKINKVQTNKENITLVNAKAKGYRTIELELSHEIDQEKAANFAAYKIEAVQKGNPGTKGIKVVAVKSLEPKKLQLSLSKRLLSMQYTLTINDVEGSKEIIPSGSRMIFMSEATSDGNLKNLLSPPSELEGYQVPNELCQKEKDKYGLLGDYKALFLHPTLLEENGDDYQFLAVATDYIRADGAGKVNLTRAENGQIQSSFSLPMDRMANGQQVPYSFDEEGMVNQESFFAFTGFSSIYESLEDEMCGENENWNTADDNNVTGAIFRNKFPLIVFGVEETTSCEKQARIICLQTNSAIKGENSPAWEAGEDGESYAGDNYMLVSSINVSANMGESLAEQGGDASLTGLKAADALCGNLVKKAAEDTSNNLSAVTRASFNKNYKHYIAVLSGQEDGKDKNARDRFSSEAYASGAYHLPNGVKVTNTLEDFFNAQGGLLAPITITEQGNDLELQDSHHLWLENDSEKEASEVIDEALEYMDNLFSFLQKNVSVNFVHTGSNNKGEILNEKTCQSWTSTEGELATGFAFDSFFSLYAAQDSGAYFRYEEYVNLPTCEQKQKLYCAYNQPKV